MSRPRVLVLSEVFPPRQGGSGRWLWELYRRLPALDVSVVAGAVSGDEAFDRAAPLPIERLVTTFPSWGLISPRGAHAYLRAARQVRAAAARSRAQRIHAARCLPEGLVALILRAGGGPPYWCVAHGEELTLARSSRELRWLASTVLRHAERVVANSQHTRRLLLEDWKLPGDRVVVLTPGVDTARFVPAPPDPVLRQSLGWEGRRVILTVGALQKRKGQDMLIRALPAIRQRCPDVLYAIAGEGWERSVLEGLAADQGVAEAVSFLGVPAEDRLVPLYQQCDLFALPNRQVGWDFEGFGIVLLEAQACGRPVIAGASGGTAETIRPGETGELVACDEPEPLAAACISLLEDPIRRSAWGASARDWVAGRFDWTILTAQADALFSAPMSSQARPAFRPAGGQ